MGFSYILIVIIMIAYSTMVSYGAVRFGLVDILPALMLMLCSIITLVLTFMKSSGVLFGLRDYDMIMSLPISSSIVVLSRMTFVYIMNLLISFIVLAPSIVLYGINTDASISVYVMLLLALLLAPLIPMVIACAVGVLITAIAVRFKHKNVFSLVLNTILIIGILYFSTTLNKVDTKQLTDLGIAVENSVKHFYPIAGIFSDAIRNNDWIQYSLFAFISIVLCTLFIAFTAKFYSKINTALLSHSGHVKYHMNDLKMSSPFKNLYKKELRRLISCTIYAFNSCIGSLLLIVAGVGVLIVNPSKIIAGLGFEGQFVENYMSSVPFLLALFIGMSSTTSSSLSLEGKSRWLMCSAPVKAETIFISKIAANLTVLIPSSLIGSILFSLALKADFLQTIFMFLIPLAFSLFISTIGMFFNVKFPKYDWTTEYYAVKQGISVLLTIIVGMIAPLLLLGISVVFSKYVLLIQILATLLILFVTYCIYQNLKKVKLYMD